MQIDWTTFILEILNFLVLVWILQRFLYRPVLALLAARQQRIDDEAESARRLRDEAEQLRRQYESRLTDWQQECEACRRQLNEELASAKEEAMAALKKALADEEAKQQARNEALLASREAALVKTATGEAFGLAAAMLGRLASPQLTHSITRVFLEDLAALSEADQTALRKAAASLAADSPLRVISAHVLDEDTQAAVEQALSEASGRALASTHTEDPALIAGIRAVVGECQLHANLADELAFFRRQANHVR